MCFAAVFHSVSASPDSAPAKHTTSAAQNRMCQNVESRTRITSCRPHYPALTAYHYVMLQSLPATASITTLQMLCKGLHAHLDCCRGLLRLRCRRRRRPHCRRVSRILPAAVLSPQHRRRCRLHAAAAALSPPPPLLLSAPLLASRAQAHAAHPAQGAQRIPGMPPAAPAADPAISCVTSRMLGTHQPWPILSRFREKTDNN